MPEIAKTKSSKADLSHVYLKHLTAPVYRLFPLLALSSEFFSSCVSLTHVDTQKKKKADKKPEEVKTVQHLTENLDRKLQIVFDLFHATTTAFSRFKIQFLFKQTTKEKKHPNKTVSKYFYPKHKGNPILGMGCKTGQCGLYKTVVRE